MVDRSVPEPRHQPFKHERDLLLILDSDAHIRGVMEFLAQCCVQIQKFRQQQNKSVPELVAKDHLLKRRNY
jgi:hypothetical protein